MCYVECKKNPTTVDQIRDAVGQIVTLMKKEYVKMEEINGRVYIVFKNEDGRETGAPLPKEQWDIKKGL